MRKRRNRNRVGPFSLTTFGATPAAAILSRILDESDSITQQKAGLLIQSYFKAVKALEKVNPVWQRKFELMVMKERMQMIDQDTLLSDKIKGYVRCILVSAHKKYQKERLFFR